MPKYHNLMNSIVLFVTWCFEYFYIYIFIHYLETHTMHLFFNYQLHESVWWRIYKVLKKPR